MSFFSSVRGNLGATGRGVRRGEPPTWVTGAGQLAKIYDSQRASKNSFSLSATAPAGETITSYSVTSGSLPSGMALGSANGVIHNTASAVASNSNSSFTVTATSTGGGTAQRSFFIQVIAPQRIAYGFVSGGGDQNFTAPDDIIFFTVSVWGAGGSSEAFGNQTPSGAGGFSRSTISCSTGESFKIVVGAGGLNTGDNFRNYGGGGAADGSSQGGQGGGCSGIFSGTFPIFTLTGSDWLATANAHSRSIVVAGGGGGAGIDNGDILVPPSGGGLVGRNSGTTGGFLQGAGGTQTAGGAIGTGDVGPQPEAGGALKGGNSGSPASAGGGGYYGGGGGRHVGGIATGHGGGGSGFVGFVNGTTSTVLTATGGNGSDYTDSVSRTNGSRTYTNSTTLRADLTRASGIPSSPLESTNVDYLSVANSTLTVVSGGTGGYSAGRGGGNGTNGTGGLVVIRF